MSKISFEGIGEVAATFVCGEGVEAGEVVKVTGNGTVDACAAGEKFGGVALTVDGGYGTVQLAGLVKVKLAASHGVSVGWNHLLADGSGGVKKDGASAPTGREHLVIAVDSDGAVVRL